MLEIVERIVLILGTLASAQSGQLSLAEIARLTRLPKTTVFRLLTALDRQGVVAFDSQTRTYALGPEVLRWGLNVKHHRDLRRVALPVMERLTEETGETSYLSVVDGYYGIYIERVESSHHLLCLSPIGYRYPLCCGASRKILLAYAEGIDLHAVLRVASKECAGRVPDYEELRADLEQIKRQGYAVSFGEAVEGVTGIAAPVRGSSGKVVAGLAVGAPSARAAGRVEVLVEQVVKAAEEVSARLGWGGP